VWDAMEAEELALQPEIEKTALELFGRDRELALEYLTLYSNALAVRSLETARRLIRDFPEAR